MEKTQQLSSQVIFQKCSLEFNFSNIPQNKHNLLRKEKKKTKYNKRKITLHSKIEFVFSLCDP